MIAIKGSHMKRLDTFGRLQTKASEVSAAAPINTVTRRDALSGAVGALTFACAILGEQKTANSQQSLGSSIPQSQIPTSEDVAIVSWGESARSELQMFDKAQ